MCRIIHKTLIGTIMEVSADYSSIDEIVTELDIPVNRYPTVCSIDDIPIMRKDWKTLDLQSGEYKSKQVVFTTIPQGDVFKGLLSLIATIALTIFAPYAAGLLAPFLGISSTLGLQLLQAGIVLAGSFLINTFLAPTPNNPSSKGGVASPTYSLTGQGNRARLFEAIPKLYGKHILYPDYAAIPYSEYVGNQQYLNQLFCLGLGEYQVHQQSIEDSAYWNETSGMLPAFTGIEMEIIPPGEAVTLFHSQVITSVEVGGQDLYNWSNTPDFGFQFTASNRRITAQNATNVEPRQFRLAAIGQRIQVTSGANQGIYTISSIATNLTWIEVVEPLVNATYNTTVRIYESENWIGPYVANPANTITNKLQIDYVFPNGLFYTGDNGQMQNETASVSAQARLIDSAGLPIGNWFNLGSHTFTRKTPTPQRFTRSYNVSDGRYEVRVHRTDAESARSRYRSAVQWAGLKAFIPNDNIYPNVTLLAVRMLATGQLTQNSSKKINTIQTAKLPIYNATTKVWSAPTTTRSIAWTAADVLRNEIYAAGYNGAYIDLDRLVELDTLWANRGDTFNGVFDTTYSVWEALTMILRVGRAFPVPVAGRITFMRDEPRALPRGVFTPANIKRTSVEIRHILFDDEAPDDIIVQFLDERTWKQNEVQCKQIGSESNKPERLQIFGITSRLQAWREGMFIGAVNAKRRIIGTFTTEMEGRVLLRGDLISLASDIEPDWGQIGEVHGYVAGTREIWLSEPIDWKGQTSAYIMLRKRNGEGWGPVKILPYPNDSYKAIVDEEDLIITQASQGPIVNTFNLESDTVLTTYIICFTEDQYRDFIIVSGVPKDNLVDLTCVIEDPSVHLADLGTPPTETYPYVGTTDPSRPVITFFAVSEDPNSDANMPTVNFAWAPDSNADYYRLEISYDNTEWETIYSGQNLQFQTQVFPGALFSRVQGINTQAGAYKTFDAVFGILTTAPLPTQLITCDYSVSGGSLSVEWSAAIRASSYRLVIYTESVPGSGNYDTVKLARNTYSTGEQFNSDEILAVGGPWESIKVGVTSINSVSESDEASIIVSGIGLDPVSNLSLQTTYNRTAFTIQWTHSNAEYYDVKVRVDGIVKLQYNSYANTQLVSLDDMVAVGGPWRIITVEVTAVAGTLYSTTQTRTYIAPTILPITGAGGVYSLGNVALSFNQTTDNGVDKTRIYHNTVNNFGTATLINEQTKLPGTATTYNHTISIASGMHYYFIVAYDSTRNQESTPVGLSVNANETLGSNLVTNGTFDSDTIWNKGSGWSIAGGKASKTTGTTNSMTQPVTLTIGANYLIKVTVLDLVQTGSNGSTIRFTGGTNVPAPKMLADGNYEFVLVPVTGNVNISLTQDSTVSWSADNVSVQKIN